MRIATIGALILLCGCASEQLALAPPAGVDFSGRWTLNEADSDDPQRLVMSQLSGPQSNSPSQGGQGGQGGGGRGGGRGGRGGGAQGMPLGAGPAVPPLPAVTALSAGLAWPGKELEVKQVAGVVAMTSGGTSRVFQPTAGARRPRHKPHDDDAGRDGRDVRPRVRGEGPPPIAGWDDKTLVVQTRDADEDHPPYEERFSLSADGARLVEVIGFKGGRSQGFTMSRVWDRVP